MNRLQHKLFFAFATLAAAFTMPRHALAGGGGGEPTTPYIEPGWVLPQFTQTGVCPGEFCQPPVIFRIPWIDDNPDGSGLPLVEHVIQVPAPVFGKLYQVADDNQTLLGPIVSGDQITNADGYIAMVPAIQSLTPFIFRTTVTNAFGLTRETFMTMTGIGVNFPPVAVEKYHTVFSTYESAEINLTYSDPNGGPSDPNHVTLAVIFTRLPEHGSLYFGSVGPENLVELGAEYLDDNYVYVPDPDLLPGCDDPPGDLVGYDALEFYVTDGEYDSNIALNPINIRHEVCPPDISQIPTLLEVFQHDEHAEILFKVTPSEFMVPEHIFVTLTEVPSKGVTQYQIPNGPWLTITTPISTSGVQLPGFVDENGDAACLIRYVPQNSEPTAPGDSSMMFEYSVSDLTAVHYWDQRMDVNILPLTCSDDFLPGDCCHPDCYASWCEGDVCTDFCDPLEGASVHFDGDARYIDLGTLGAYEQMLNHGTIETWFRTGHTDAPMTLTRTLSVADGVVQEFRVVFNSGTSGPAPGHIILRRSRVGQVTNSRVRAYDLMDAFDNEWHHFAWRFDASADMMELYIDGVLREPVSTDDSGASPQLAPTTDALFLGAASLTGVPSSFFVGQLDELRLWSTPRDPQDIVLDMHRVVDPDTEHLLGYWRLDEGTGTEAENLASGSGTPSTATLVNFPSWIDAYPCAPAIPGDLNDDGVVDIEDLNVVLSAWGECPSGTGCAGDIVPAPMGDGLVNIDDLNIVLANWG